LRGGAEPVAPRRDCGGRPTIAAVLDSVAAALTGAGFDEPRRRARRLVAAALGVSEASVFAHQGDVLAAAEQGRIAALLRRSLAHEPLSRFVGRREFWGLDLMLSPETLDPRPDSETVVEAILARLPERRGRYRFLDLGTGTGCLLLALLSEYPEASGVGIDIAAGAACTARGNAERLRLGDRAAFVVGDWGRAMVGGFDAVVANPPYIASAAISALPPEVRNYDPWPALDGGADGLQAYRAIAADLPRLLHPAGCFATEIGAGQANAVAGILAAAGLRIERLVLDLAGIVRCLVAAR
jgi:release factor glutamine methyltransferase